MRSTEKALVAALALLLTLALGVTMASATAPVVNIDSGFTASYTTAHVSGEVDPEDQDTFWWFQYAIDPEAEGWTDGPEAGVHVLAANQPATPVSDDLTGLRAGTKYQVRLLAVPTSFAEPETFSAGPNPTITTKAVVAPDVEIDPVTTFTGTTAKFSGTIDPNAPEAAPTSASVEAGFKVEWHFECTPECPGLQGGTVAADDAIHTVEADASGLEPDTSYEVLLVASNSGSSVTKGPRSFNTEPVAPEAQTLYAGELGVDDAALAATVNPKNSPVTYQFEWGTDEGYGNLAPSTPQPLAVADDAFHVVTAPLSGLAKGATYHFRIVAENTDTSERSEGVDHIFTTLADSSPPAAGLPDGRVYEVVSPLDKASADIDAGTNFSGSIGQASVSGSSVAYGSLGNFGGDNGSLYLQYLSRRAAGGGWSSEGINPRLAPAPCRPCGTSYQWFSPDLSRAAVQTEAPLNPGDPDENANLYLRDNLAGSYQLLSKPTIPIPQLFSETFAFAGASADLSHLVIQSKLPLTPDGAPGVYEMTGGQLRPVAVLPGGVAPNSLPGGADQFQAHEFAPSDHFISDDGSRIYFSAADPGGQRLGIYLREDGSTTKNVSISEAVGPNPPETNAILQLSSADGSLAFFTDVEKRTDDATANCVNGECRADLYRWDADDPDGSRLSDITTQDPEGAGVLGTVAASDDARRVYFAATGNLAPGGLGKAPKLFIWEEGAGTRWIANLSLDDSALWNRDRKGVTRNYAGAGARVTSDGEVLIFGTHARVTGYDNFGYRQLYGYDAGNRDVRCISCNTRAKHSSADADFLYQLDNATSSLTALQLPRNLSGDGSRLFFDSSEALLPQDTDGKVDVYEWQRGSLRLISSGGSDRDSKFLDASASGDDVFFTTGESLVRSDSDDLVDLYDASVGGVEEPAPTPACQGDECQGRPTPPPAFANPGTASLSGPGSVTANHRHHPKRHRKKHKGRHLKQHRAQENGGHRNG